MTATVEVEGLPENCPNTATDSIFSTPFLKQKLLTNYKLLRGN